MIRVCILFLLVCAPALSAQEQYWLKVISAGVSGQVKLNYPARTNTREDRSLNLEKVTDYCREKGFLTATIDSTREKGDTLWAYLNAGAVYQWARLSAGNASEAACNYSGFREKIFRNRALDPRQFSKLMQKLLHYYQNSGYPFAKIGLDSVQITENSIQALLRVQTGDIFLVDSLNYRGEARISNRYLQNYLGIRPGDIYQEDQMKAINTRLREIPFIQVYRPSDVYLVGRSALVRLYLNEKKASNFSGIVGVLPNSSQEGKLVLTGEASLRIRNGLGRGEAIDAEWRRLQVATQSLNAGVSWPFLFNTPFGFSGTFNLYKKDTSFISIQPNIGIQYLMRGTDYLKAFYEARNSSLLSTRGLANISVLPDFADIGTSLYGLEFSITRLDYRFNPRKGYKMITRASAGRRKIRKNAGVNPSVYDALELNTIQINSMIDADVFIPLFRRSTFNAGLLANWMESPALFENELPRIGGINSLKGFNEESIFASSYAIINLEYRYLFEENAYMFAFVNGAWYENRAVNRNLSDLPYGFGAGISFETKAGIFSISYALGSERNNPVQLRAAKVHFGINSLF
jgi:outer membrane protein assembly factor BamA